MTLPIEIVPKRAQTESTKKDSQALFFLQQAMVDEIFSRIMGAASAKEAWDTLQEEFQGNAKVCAVKL